MDEDNLWTVKDVGAARIVERVHVGTQFEVYCLAASSRRFALKVPAPMHGEDYDLFAARRVLGGISTVWDVMCYSGSPADRGDHRRDLPTASPEELLTSEAKILEHVGGGWNNHFEGLQRGALGSRRGVLGLITTWLDGDRLDALPRAHQRTLIVRMMPAFWDALTLARHGDLHASNIIIAPDRRIFSLIDPGAHVLHRRGVFNESCGADKLTFVTTPMAYPVLPPYYVPHAPLTSIRGLHNHWRSFLDSMTLSNQYPPSVRDNVMVHVVSHSGGRFLTKPATPCDEPFPADLLALAVLYYQALTGQHPFPKGAVRPAWVGLTSVDNELDGDESAAWLCEPVIPPTTLDPNVHPSEEALAMTLLDLRVDSRAKLSDLVRSVLASRGGREV